MHLFIYMSLLLLCPFFMPDAFTASPPHHGAFLQEFVLERGPDRLLSECVSSMSARGFCVLPALLPTSLTDHLREACEQVQDPTYSGDATCTWNFTGKPVSGQPKGVCILFF